MQNFHTSWQDGTAFCGLIEAFRPELIDMSKVKKSDRQEDKIANLNLAFETAQEHLGISKAAGTNESGAPAPDSATPDTTVYGTPIRA